MSGISVVAHNTFSFQGTKRPDIVILFALDA